MRRQWHRESTWGPSQTDTEELGLSAILSPNASTRTHTECRDQTDAEAGKEAAGQEQGDAGRDRLQDDAEVEDPGGNYQGQAPANLVGHEGRCQGAEESSGRQDRHDGRLLRARDGEVVGARFLVSGAEEALPIRLHSVSLVCDSRAASLPYP